VRQLGLQNDGRLARVRDVDGGDVLRRRFVGQPEDATPIARQLDDHALAAVAEAAEVVLGKEPHPPGEIRLAHGAPPSSHPSCRPARGAPEWAPLLPSRRPRAVFATSTRAVSRTSESNPHFWEARSLSMASLNVWYGTAPTIRVPLIWELLPS